MKRTFLLAFLFLPLIIAAQSIKNGGVKLSPAKRNIVDSSNVRVYYKMTWAVDPTAPNTKSEAQTVLLIGNNDIQFCDLPNLMLDSLTDATYYNKETSAAYFSKAFPIIRQKCYGLNVVKSLHSDAATIQDNRGGVIHFIYSDNIPAIHWQLMDGDTLLAGQDCKKAATRYRGRDYVAWYADKIALPFGPYVFGGLPGLIMKVSDTKGYFDYELNGLEQRSHKEPIYLFVNRKEVKTTREGDRKGYKNYCDHPDEASKAFIHTLMMTLIRHLQSLIILWNWNEQVDMSILAVTEVPVQCSTGCRDLFGSSDRCEGNLHRLRDLQEL